MTQRLQNSVVLMASVSLPVPGSAVVHVGSSDWRVVGRLGAALLPADHRLLHLRSDPPDEAQPLVGLPAATRQNRGALIVLSDDFCLTCLPVLQVVLRHDLHVWSLFRHLLRHLRLRSRRDRRARAQHRLRFGESRR